MKNYFTLLAFFLIQLAFGQSHIVHEKYSHYQAIAVDPAYGIAAGDAGILKQCLKEVTSLEDLPALYFKRQAKFQRNAYTLACYNDLKFDTVVGPRPLKTRLFNWYVDQINRAGAADSYISREYGLVNLLIEPISLAFKPWFMLRVLFARLFLWWKEEPGRTERVAPIPPEPAEIPTRWRSEIRNWFGIAFRFTQRTLGLAR